MPQRYNLKSPHPLAREDVEWLETVGVEPKSRGWITRLKLPGNTEPQTFASLRSALQVFSLGYNDFQDEEKLEAEMVEEARRIIE